MATNSLRHLPRRSSKNCQLQFANGDRFKENCSIDTMCVRDTSLYSICLKHYVLIKGRIHACTFDKSDGKYHMRCLDGNRGNALWFG